MNGREGTRDLLERLNNDIHSIFNDVK